MHGKAGAAMTKQKPKRKGVVRGLRSVVILIVAAVLGLVGWNYLAPIVTADSIPLYERYTVEQGNIQTTLSFSASLNVKKSETHTAGEMSKVKELYVQSGDAVLEGDPLVLLTNGELFTAGFDGAVNEIRVGVGDWVRPNFSIVQVSDLVNLEVSMDVDEYDVKSLQVGERCIVRIISLGEEFETTIAHINRVSSSSGTLAYYTVTCDLSVPEEVLPGMRTTVTIADRSVQDVAMLPLEAVSFDEESQQPYVLLDDTGDESRQYIETGLSDGMNVEITGGVGIGDTVYALRGTESAAAAFSLEELYVSMVGKKVVINEAQGLRGGNMGGWGGKKDGTDAAMPDGTTLPDGTVPGMPDTSAPAGTQGGSGVQDTQPETTDTNLEP